jgi:hypothetical protein
VFLVSAPGTKFIARHALTISATLRSVNFVACVDPHDDERRKIIHEPQPPSDHVSVLPASPESVAAFLAHEAERQIRPSTIGSRVTSWPLEGPYSISHSREFNNVFFRQTGFGCSQFMPVGIRLEESRLKFTGHRSLQINPSKISYLGLMAQFWWRRLRNLYIEVDKKIEERLSGATHRQAQRNLRESLEQQTAAAVPNFYGQPSARPSEELAFWPGRESVVRRVRIKTEQVQPRPLCRHT